MYRRDFGILFVSIFAIFWALQHEGSYQYRKAFYYELEQDPYELFHNDVLPPPVVADLNGDGSSEVILVTHSNRLEVLSPKAAARQGDGFAKATLIGSTDLAASRVKLPAGRRAVALAVGHVDAPSASLAVARRKMVIVVVTAGWQALCYDHNLKLLWERSVHDAFPRHATIEEVAILITHHKVKEQDRGLIIVGGSVSLGDLAEEGGEDAVVGDDAFYQELADEEDELKHAHGEREQTVKGDLDGPHGGGEVKHGVDMSRNFQWHALEGGSGAERWHNAGSDYHRDLDELKDALTPQHDYRLDAAALEGRRYGEVSCRDFRESILHVLPHSWSAREDTKMELAYFAKHRPSRDVDAKRFLAIGAPPRDRLSGGAALKGLDKRSVVTSALGTVASRAAASGKKGPMDSDPRHPPPHHRHPSNAIVAHLREGLDVVNLYNGHPLCKLHLPADALHADVNGDGVLDRVVAIGSTFEQRLGAHAHGHMEHCHGYVHSGLPAAAPLFNGSICKNHMAADLLSSRGAHGQQSAVEMAPPVMLPVPSASGRYRSVRGQHGLTVFLNSRGELTAFDFHGSKRWQLQTAASWLNHPGERRGQRVHPTLLAIPVHTHAVPTAVLIAGTHTAAAYGLNGELLDMVELPEAPAQPFVPTDFNGDGLTDLLMLSRTHVYGFQLVRHLGAGLPYAALLGCLMVAMAVVYITQQGPAAGPNKRFRSTDRVD